MFETTNGPGSLQRHGGAALGGLFAGRGGGQCTHRHRGDQFGAPAARRHRGANKSCSTCVLGFFSQDITLGRAITLKPKWHHTCQLWPFQQLLHVFFEGYIFCNLWLTGVLRLRAQAGTRLLRQVVERCRITQWRWTTWALKKHPKVPWLRTSFKHIRTYSNTRVSK